MMNAVELRGPENYGIVKIPIPDVGDDQVLLKVTSCGICGTDLHFIEGQVSSVPYPIYPGHEVVGRVFRIGKGVNNVKEGDRCVVDPVEPVRRHIKADDGCTKCFFCQRSKFTMCINIKGYGVNQKGGFADYILVSSSQVYKINNLSDAEATLVEPASNIINATDKLDLQPGADVLVLGAGPAGLLFARLLRLNGAAKVVIASNKGVKMNKARELNVADEYVDFDRQNPDKEWEYLKLRYPYGFDAVVEATGSEKVLNRAIKLVQRAGTLMLYAVYTKEARVDWSPLDMFLNEIRILTAYAQSKCFARAIAYLDSGAVNIEGMVSHVYPLQDFSKAVEILKKKEALHIVIAPDQ